MNYIFLCRQWKILMFCLHFTVIFLNLSFNIACSGGFNQPIMCGGEPRAMLRKDRGKADSPIYSIQICVPKHGNMLL